MKEPADVGFFMWINLLLAAEYLTLKEIMIYYIWAVYNGNLYKNRKR